MLQVLHLLQERTKINLIKIIDALKTYGQLHIRGIHRVTGINPLTVSTLVQRYGRFFDIDVQEVVPGFGTKFVRLKNPSITIEDIERDIQLRKNIRNNMKVK